MGSFRPPAQCAVQQCPRLCISAEHVIRSQGRGLWHLGAIHQCAAVQITYDIYKPYFHKNASSKELLLVSRVAVAFFGLVMACVSVIFYKVCQMLPLSPAQLYHCALPCSSCPALLQTQVALPCCKITLPYPVTQP